VRKPECSQVPEGKNKKSSPPGTPKTCRIRKNSSAVEKLVVLPRKVCRGATTEAKPFPERKVGEDREKKVRIYFGVE